jgi:hypothetical protein
MLTKAGSSPNAPLPFTNVTQFESKSSRAKGIAFHPKR